MLRRLKITVLLIALPVFCYVAYAVVSASYTHDPSVINEGGAICGSASYENLGTVDESAVGIAQSANYRSEAGFIYMLPGPTEEWLRITQQPNPAVLGTGGECAFAWVSDRDGTFEMRINSMLLDSGNCSATVPENQVVYESDLDDNSENRLSVIVDAGTDQASVLVSIVDDQISPVFTRLEFTQVTGGITDTDAVAEVVVNDVPATITDDTFVCSVTSGTTELVVETRNADGQVIGLKKTIRILP